MTAIVKKKLTQQAKTKAKKKSSLEPGVVVAERPPARGMYTRNNRGVFTDTIVRLRERLEDARQKFDDGVWFRLARFTNSQAAWTYARELTDEYDGIEFKPTSSGARTEPRGSILYARFGG